MQPACICTQPTNPNWSGATLLKHCKCTGKHVSLLMLEKKGSSHDHLPREQKEQLVLQSVAQKGITIYIPMIMNLIFFSLGGSEWSQQQPSSQGRLLDGEVGKLESQEATQFLHCVFSPRSSGEFGGCSCCHLHSPETLSVTRVMYCKADQPSHLHAVL